MTQLHMISLVINLAPMREQMARQSLRADEGLALHHFLSETFGKGIIQPFRLMPGRSNAPTATLYGYGTTDAAKLNETASLYATPDLLKVFELSSLASKPIPTDFDTGKRLGFDVRVRPVRRIKTEMAAESREVRRSKLRNKTVAPFKPGSEVDAFLIDRMRANPTLTDQRQGEETTREACYMTWLAKRLGDAATLDTGKARLARYERRTVWRGGKPQEGPDATIHGELSVEDPARFAALMAGGVGRHTAYGYGMLLLRPPRF